MNNGFIEKILAEFLGKRVPNDIPSTFKCADSIAKTSYSLWLSRAWDHYSGPDEKTLATIWLEEKTLHVFALMEDSDVFSDAVGKNDKTWAKGDVMEFFFQPDHDRNYFELHLAPNFATLELSIPDIVGFRSGQCVFEDMFFDSGMSCESASFNQSGVKGWWGLMKIPVKSIGLKIQRGTLGKFCICRYNYSRNSETTVEHSASAALPTFDFHQPEHWQNLVFE